MAQIYLAAPFFSETQIDKASRLEKALKENTTVKDFYSPRQFQEADYPKFTVPWGKQIYDLDMSELRKSDIVVCIIDYDGQDIDSGTAYELGAAKMMGKHTVGVQEDGDRINLMIANCLDAYYTKIEDVKNYDFNKLESHEFDGKVF